MDASSPINDFYTDDAWQKEMRDTFLVPYYRETFAGFLLFDGKDDFSLSMQARGIDTLTWRSSAALHSFEEKMARFKGKVYDAICLETHTCTVPGHIEKGWMYYCEAEFLFYGIETGQGDLDCLLIPFKKLQPWFWDHYREFPIHVMPGKNRSETRVVKIDRIIAAIPTTRRLLFERPAASAAA